MGTSVSIAVVTDSAAGIPAELQQRYNISVIPYWVHIGNDAYISGKTIGPEAFFRELRSHPEVKVHTGVPAVAKFIELYRKLSSWAKGIVSVHVAGKQSGTCSVAEVAGRESPVPVVVIDSETTAMAEGFVAVECAREAIAGGTLEQVIERARSVIPNVSLLALLETVTYALKGGRLSSAAGKVGTLLKIQPLIRVQENRLSLVGQVRRRNKGLKLLVDKIAAEIGGDPVHLTVHYAEDEEEGRNVLEALKARLNCVEAYLTHVPVELGVHAGPGSIGIAYYVERERIGLAERISRLGNQAKEAIRSKLP